MKKPEEPTNLRLRHRPTRRVSIEIPTDTMGSIEDVARARDMSPDALIRFYIGQGLRQDKSRLHVDRVLEPTA